MMASLGIYFTYSHDDDLIYSMVILNIQLWFFIFNILQKYKVVEFPARNETNSLRKKYNDFDALHNSHINLTYTERLRKHVKSWNQLVTLEPFYIWKELVPLKPFYILIKTNAGRLSLVLPTLRRAPHML